MLLGSVASDKKLEKGHFQLLQFEELSPPPRPGEEEGGCSGELCKRTEAEGGIQSQGTAEHPGASGEDSGPSLSRAVEAPQAVSQAWPDDDTHTLMELVPRAERCSRC